jgi:hypothetical protein
MLSSKSLAHKFERGMLLQSQFTFQIFGKRLGKLLLSKIIKNGKIRQNLIFKGVTKKNRARSFLEKVLKKIPLAKG